MTRHISTIVFDALDNAIENCPELFHECSTNIGYDLCNRVEELNNAPVSEVILAVEDWINENPVRLPL